MKDPYFKPVVFCGLMMTLLSIVFAPGIFLWAIVAGYIAVRLSYKLTKELITLTDSLLLGLFSGLVGGTLLNILAILSFKNPDNKKVLISTLKKNWPPDMQPMPEFSELLPSIFLSTCLIIIVVCVVFCVIGTFIGYITTKRKASKETEKKES